MKAALLLLFAALAMPPLAGAEPVPQITLHCDQKEWVAATSPSPHVLEISIRNTLGKETIFTSYETFLPFIKKANGQMEAFRYRGRDHWRLPMEKAFIRLKPDEQGVLRASIRVGRAKDKLVLWYECLTGDVYSCDLAPGTYQLGIRYRVPADFFDGFNDPKREAYHQPWDDPRLIWIGTVDSDVITVTVKAE